MKHAFTALAFSEEQSPLVMADEYYGEINKSSVKRESDLAPCKPKCDVIVIGSAYAPEKRPARFFRAGISITNAGKTILNKELVITGPRFWKKRFLLPGWKLTYPERTMSVPLRYEYAHGGECRINAGDPAAKRVRKKYRLTPEQRQQYPGGIETAPVANTACETNAVGSGYAEKWYLKAKRLRKIPAPQIESIHERVKKFRKHYAAQGFGVITRTWTPRRQLAGTADEAFAKSDKWLPNDFDMAYWNCAHPDMQIPKLQGDETIALTNLLPFGNETIGKDSVCKLILPGHKPYALVRLMEGQIFPADFEIDTLIIDTDKKKLNLVYRLNLSKEREIRVLEARMMNNDEKKALEAEKKIATRALQHEVAYG